MSTHSIVRNFNPEYGAARTEVAFHDRSDRGRLRLQGPKAREILTGMVTNDITALAPGTGCYAAALTAKGKIVADLRSFAFTEDVLTDVPPRAREGWQEMVRKFVNPRVSPYRVEFEAMSQIALIGPRSTVLLAELGVSEADAAGMEPYHHRSVGDVIVARVPDFGVTAFEIFLPAAAAEPMRERLREAGARTIGRDTIEVLRVEAGRPEWGVDMDDGTLAQEANLDELGAISYTKGCYVGQETVARIHFRGHVNRHLRGLQVQSDLLPPPGSELLDDAGKTVGDTRTVVRSPRLGPIGLAMVRREVEIGTRLQVNWEGGEAAVIVAPLPFAT